MSTYPVDYEEPFNPRFRLFRGHLERNFKALELAEDLEDGKARNVFLALGDCFPTGSPADSEGASSRLVNDLIRDGELEDEDIADFMRIAFESGGLSVGQVRHIISGLESKSQKSKRSI